MEVTLETLVARAKEGDRDALEEVVRAIQDRVYGLALRMLWHPDDAADATQEILIRIVTHLGTFHGESAFMTWAYRVASNFLLTTRKRRAEREELTFRSFGAQLDEGLSDAPLQAAPDVEERLLVEEMKIGCTHGMLLCLDRDQRLAYILGEICEVTSEEGSYVLGISPAAFRKRLSRARARLQAFMQRKCGLINPANPCRCTRRVNHAIQIGRIDPQRLLFAGGPGRETQHTVVVARVREMEELQSTAVLFRSHPSYAAPRAYAESIRKLVESGRFAVLS
jgi:RNA polymerase sigma factor (sigma-70 family)